jgi:hypothetical protein
LKKGFDGVAMVERSAGGFRLALLIAAANLRASIPFAATI